MCLKIIFFSSGWILIDRCGKHFGTLLNYLRDGSVALPKAKRDLEELQTEAKYYLVQDLARQIDAELKRVKDLDPICRVPLITSQKEEQALLANTTKV